MLLLKLLLVPGLVAAVTLAVRRWGPAVGGWLAGLPVVAGPVLVFYALEQGDSFAASAAHATMTGLIGTAAFAMAYGRSSARLPWYGCVAIGWAVFAVCLVGLYAFRPGLFPSFALLVATTVAGRWLVNAGRARPQAGPPLGNVERVPPKADPPGDLPLRLIATAVLVLVLTGLAGRLGSTWSGLLNAFPVLTTIVAVFSHAQRGTAAAVAFLTGYLQAIVGFGLFCGVMAVALERLGLPLALFLALAMQFAWHSILVVGTARPGTART